MGAKGNANADGENGLGLGENKGGKGMEKEMNSTDKRVLLGEEIAKLGGVVVAFSGGVDSTCLLYTSPSPRD